MGCLWGNAHVTEILKKKRKKEIKDVSIQDVAFHSKGLGFEALRHARLKC